MRLSCNPIIYYGQLVHNKSMRLDEWFATANALGLDGTEVHYRSLSSCERGYIENLKDQLDANGLALSQLIVAPDFSHPDSNVRASEIEQVCQYVDIAKSLEATCIRVTTGQAHPTVGREEGIEYVVSAMRAVLAYADAIGVWAAYENQYKDAFWDYQDFACTHEMFLEIFDRLSNSPLKINFDFSNSLMLGEEPIELLSKVLAYVIHVHCNDRPSLYDYTHCIVGKGLANVRELLTMLKSGGYDGWLSIEYNGSEGLSGLRESIEFVRATWAEI